MRPDGFANWPESERAAWYDSHTDEVESWMEERGETMDAATEAQALTAQIERLAEVIMNEVPGEPSQGQGAVDCAIRLIRCAYTTPETVDPGEPPMETVTLTYDDGAVALEQHEIDIRHLTNELGLAQRLVDLACEAAGKAWFELARPNRRGPDVPAAMEILAKLIDLLNEDRNQRMIEA